MSEWDDLLPPWEAHLQKCYDRHAQARRMRMLGMTYAEIGRRLGVGPSRAGSLVKYGRMRPPVLDYFNGSVISDTRRSHAYGRLYRDVQRLVAAIEEARHA